MPEGPGAMPSPGHGPCEAKVVCERTEWGPRGGACWPQGQEQVEGAGGLELRHLGWSLALAV